MGAGTRRPILPAPTDSSAIESAEEETGFGTDLATDLSRATDRTSHTIPDDGSPITISTGTKRSTHGKLSKIRKKSHASLLIEYFEGGPEPDGSRKPHVRVKVPSGSRKSSKSQDHLVFAENGPRETSHSRHISFGTDSSGQNIDRVRSTTLAALEGRQHRSVPVEVEVPGKEGSEISKLSENARYIEAPSDLSSMPADSVLEENNPEVMAERARSRSRSLDREDVLETDSLKAPIHPYATDYRNASTERLTQRVIEKLNNKPRATTSGTRRRHGEKSGSGSASKELVEEGSSRRKSSKHYKDDGSLATESSLPTNSLLSANSRSIDQGSVRSGTSQGSSIANPRLLHTVEDAIRRLILPELNQLRKDQRAVSGGRKHDKNYDVSDLSESSTFREEVPKKHRTSEGNPKVVLRSNSKDHGEVLSGHRRRSRRHKDADLDSPSERSYSRRESGASASIDGDSPHKSRSRSHRTRDMAAAALAGGALTAAALKHHESRSDNDRRERRKKRSKSRSSRSASVAESEDIFHKHEVPPMPMRSEIGSEATRSSLLSQNTADTATPMHREVREVVRGSPLTQKLESPTSSTPTRTPAEKPRGLGMHHSNVSDRHLNLTGEEPNRESYEEDNYLKWGGAAAAGGVGALAAEHVLEDPERTRAYEANLHHQHPIRRGLSPIQSVASYQTTEPNRNSGMQSRSIDSLGSFKKSHQIREELSVDSLSSVPNSIDLAKSKRPVGINLENPSEILRPHEDRFDTTRDLDEDDDDDFYEDQRSQNDRYRDSYASSDPKIDARRMTNYTDDSMDAPYLDKVTAGQQVAPGWGANPEYVHTPPGVESAVASLYDPSLVDVRSNQSPIHSYSNSVGRRGVESPGSIPRELRGGEGGSPLKQGHYPSTHEAFSERQREYISSPPRQQRDFIGSPVQSIAKSIEEREAAHAAANRSPALEAPAIPEGQDATSPESEITTNPSVIQGPIGGLSKANRDHWPYGATPPASKRLYSPLLERELPASAATAGAGALLATGLASSVAKPHDQYMSNQMPSSPGVKDEGYITGDNPKSPGLYDKSRDIGNFTPTPERMDIPPGEEDPFTTKKGQYLSGFSQGMSSPLYDSATGQGMDRIQSKDIVALMDHLTVRDAHRNARDTEILVTLVRSATEMRNSFEEMKKFIADQDEYILDTTDKQHETTQKFIGGPRPQPQSARGLQRPSQSQDSDLPTQRKNVFKRALQGLGSKNKAELQNIEGMLLQLLDEVDGLRTSQGQAAPALANQIQKTRSLNSVDNVHVPTDPGYEPEGQAGTSSTGNVGSGFFSNDSSRQDHYRGATGGLRDSGNRVSTVMEGDEEHEESQYRTLHTPIQQFANGAAYRSPNQAVDKTRDIQRGTSEPLKTPPRMQQQPDHVHFSNDNTPQGESGGKSKHKSTASSFFPRISRWSKTTASTITDNFRTSGQQKQRPYSEVSHSGSNLDDYDYDPHGDDRLRSNNSFNNENVQNRDQEDRPPSPLIPSQVSENPKYSAVRNSINLQHPQPRQGPTGRYQHHLETEAQHYGGDHLSPTSQTSSQWEQHGALKAVNPNIPTNRPYVEERDLSPISVGDYSDTSSTMEEMNAKAHLAALGPTPPPKVRDEDPLMPPRPPKIAMTPPANRPTSYVDHVAAARAGSPAYDKSPVVALRSSPAAVTSRKPSGPRPITSSGPQKGQRGDLNAVKRTRFRGSPNQIDSSSEDVTY